MNNVNRRNFLKLSGSTLIGLTLGGVALRANAQERLTEDDATAVSLGYVHESVVTDKHCSNCNYIQGAAAAEWRPCTIIPGKLVNAKGYCNIWAAIPTP